MEVSKKELDILIHTLGYNYKPRHDRNMYVTDKNDPELIKLVDKGLMDGPIMKSFLGNESAYFKATDKGHSFIKEVKSSFQTF